jgi:hypothetical protein
MEELIELIINLIARSMQGSPRKTPPPLAVNRANGAKRVEPANRAVVRTNIPGARRVPARRPVPPRIAIAQPIMTATGAVKPVATASTGTAHAVPAKSIAATAAAASPNAKPSANAATLKRWMNPSTLRQQFMLTEIFQPPLALREQYTQRP